MVKYDFGMTMACRDVLKRALQVNCVTGGKGAVNVYIRPVEDEKSGVVRRVYKNGDIQVALRFQIPENFDFSTLADAVGIADEAMADMKFVVQPGECW